MNIQSRTKMTSRLLLLLAILLGATNSGFSQSPKDQLKVISYNIWNGFDWGKDATRRVELQQWMAEQQPDVVALQELCMYTPEKLEEDAKSWGHPYSVLLKTTGYSVGLTSRFPIELNEKLFEGLHHGALHCQTNGVDFLVVHLHPGSIQRRRDECQLLTSKIEAIREQNSRFMVLGDFNAHSPYDADLYDQNGPLLTRMKKGDKGKGLEGNLINGDFDYAVISSFLALPLGDVVRKHTQGIAQRGSFPGRALGVVNNESPDELDARLERIDYILVSPEMEEQCIDAWVANGKPNWKLSDHYPVVAIFRVD
ncbi:endonuclease/exonuclease/phosphatase family protein [Sunxiuqinia sp. sy24]|uniref:endonuclease/exonuclease/phosphatase family protein n=1 Tax=Sunxiuqinia sp. sy24 TaxID=3461495 RepID=UPI00404666AD